MKEKYLFDDADLLHHSRNKSWVTANRKKHQWALKSLIISCIERKVKSDAKMNKSFQIVGFLAFFAPLRENTLLHESSAATGEERPKPHINPLFEKIRDNKIIKEVKMKGELIIRESTAMTNH